MEHLIGQLTCRLVDFFGTDARRIEHALLVLHHSLNLCREQTNIDRDIIIAAALLHDVGIKPAEAAHGYNTGKLQEKYGPDEAEKILRSVAFPQEKIAVVREIIGNHHSPSRLDYPELDVLKAADLIVNRDG